MRKQMKTTIMTTALTVMTGISLLWAADSSSGGKMEACKEMMRDRQEMMSEMKSQNQELQALTQQLNRASGEQKVDLLARVVTKLVDQRAKSGEKMEAMHQRMMQHMSQHAQKGQQSMAQCPMMQAKPAMGGSEGEDQADHSTHHSDDTSKSK